MINIAEPKKTRKLAPVKCKECGEKFERMQDGSNFVTKSKRYYHKECYEILQKAEDTEKKQYFELIDYIIKLYGFDSPTPVMFKQIQNYKNVNNYKYTGMLMCLKYIYEIENLPLRRDMGLGLIQYKYEEAKQYYINLQDQLASIEEIKPQEVKIVVTKKPKLKPRIQQIDISQL